MFNKLLEKFGKSKKAVVGATMTWVVATIIILLVVIFFIYGSYTMAKQKDISDFKVFKDKQISNTDSEQTLLALLNTEFDGKKLENYILEGEYFKIQGKVNLILDNLELEGKVHVYVGDKKIILDGDSLEVK